MFLKYDIEITVVATKKNKQVAADWTTFSLICRMLEIPNSDKLEEVVAEPISPMLSIADIKQLSHEYAKVYKPYAHLSSAVGSSIYIYIH